PPRARPPRAARSRQPHPELLAERALALGRHLQRAAVARAPHPAGGEAMGIDRGADPAGEVRAALAPVEAGAAGHGPPRRRFDVDADPVEEGDAARGDDAAVALELDVPGGDHRVGDRDAEPAGDVVVAGARRAHRRVARPDDAPRRLVRAGEMAEILD